MFMENSSQIMKRVPQFGYETYRQLIRVDAWIVSGRFGREVALRMASGRPILEHFIYL